MLVLCIPLYSGITKAEIEKSKDDFLGEINVLKDYLKRLEDKTQSSYKTVTEKLEQIIVSQEQIKKELKVIKSRL